jgi:benzoate/toluate 1,2-dioxygenase alpha subunit
MPAPLPDPREKLMTFKLIDTLDNALVDDPEAGVFRCRRDVFTDPDLFELEMKHLFEKGWVYLAHESQIPQVNDYFTTWAGRTPVVITRDKTGVLGAFVNACAHRGRPCAAASMGTRAASPVPSTAGPSATMANC